MRSIDDIILDDSAPRNVVIEQETYHPVLINFTLCFLRATMFEAEAACIEGGEA